MPRKLIVIGSLGKPFGVKGWLYADSYSDPLDSLFSFDLYLDEETPLSITHHKVHKNRFIVKLGDVETPERAREFTNKHIYVDRSSLPRTSDDEFYWCDVIGMNVHNQGQGNIGVLSHIYQQPDLVVLVVGSGKKEQHIPLLPSVLSKIDFDERIIYVAWDH